MRTIIQITLTVCLLIVCLLASLACGVITQNEATFSLGDDMLTRPASQGFDCDDSALYMYLYFTALGYDVRIVKGNLDKTGESYWETNHVWVWVGENGKGEIAYDWGRPYYDEQHSWGYVISYKELLSFAKQDQ